MNKTLQITAKEKDINEDKEKVHILNVEEFNVNMGSRKLVEEEMDGRMVEVNGDYVGENLKRRELDEREEWIDVCGMMENNKNDDLCWRRVDCNERRVEKGGAEKRENKYLNNYGMCVDGNGVEEREKVVLNGGMREKMMSEGCFRRRKQKKPLKSDNCELVICWCSIFKYQIFNLKIPVKD